MGSLQFKVEDHCTAFNKEDVWADDDFGNRDGTSRRLRAILAGQERPLTICLNGEWGSGKTFFLTRFAENYNSRNPNNGRAIYFNAWEDDFLEDPLLAIVCQLKKAAPDEMSVRLLDSVKQAALPCLRKIGLSLTKQFVKNKIGIDFDAVETDDLKATVESVFDQYENLEISRRVLRESLTKFAEEAWQKTEKPLLFIVDELDRCRPTFAIELLERIKHLFCVPHLVFIIGADVGQLEKSINAVYGDIDSHDYLHRFFDVEFRLPKADRMAFVYRLWDALQLEASLQRRGVSGGDQQALLGAFSRLIRYRNVTLRQIEQCVRVYALLAVSKHSMSCRWALLAAVAVVLKVTDLELYLRFVHMEFGLAELIDTLFPGVTVDDINGDEEVNRLIGHLIKIAYYGNSNSDMHKRLEVVHSTIGNKQDIKFDPEVMPRCFSECAQSELVAFFQRVFNERQAAAYEYRGVPKLLREMDEGIRFLS